MSFVASMCLYNNNQNPEVWPGELLIGMQVCFGFQTSFRFKYYFSPFPKKIKLPMMLLHVSCVSVPLK